MPETGPTEKATPAPVTPSAPKRSVQARAGAWLARKWLAVLIVLAALVFVLSNLDQVHLKFLAFDIYAPAWMFSAVLFLAGMLTGVIFAHRKKNAGAGRRGK